MEAARRELIEETGAEVFEIAPICFYATDFSGMRRHGLLCFAEIEKIGDLPDSEIESVTLSDTLPKNLTYPDIQPHLFEKVIEFLSGKKEPQL